ncbi:MAG: cobalamin-dependent protein [Planctomycetota bacterium]|nr:cobalamin-dependent protein [Planctomycetota bacterium]
MQDDTGDIGGALVGALLREAAAEIARDAVTALLLADADVVARAGAQGADRWREAIGARVVDLSDALAAGLPEMFRSQMGWARVAYASRGVRVSDLAAALDALAGVLPRHVPEEDRELVLAYLRPARADLAGDAPEPPAFLRAGPGLERAAGEYMLALLEGERVRAWEVVAALAGRGVGTAEIYTGVLTPVLQEIGRMWHMGEVHIAEEHFATATTLIVMSRLAGMATRAPARGKTAVCAGVAGNAHEVGPRMASDLLELDGWRVVYLGVDMPREDLALGCADFKADVLVLSAAIPAHVREAEDTIRALRGTLGPAMPRVIVGGRPFDAYPGLWRQVGADALARDPLDCVRLANELTRGA